MVTLLMVLFIVMFAMSQVDQKKFDVLKDGLAAGFGSSASPFQGSEGTILEAPSGIKPRTRSPPRPRRSTDAGQAAGRRDQRPTEPAAADRRLRQGRARRSTGSRRSSKRIEKALAGQGLPATTSATKIDERGLAISLVSRHVVFRAERGRPVPARPQVLDVLAPVLRSLPEPLRRRRAHQPGQGEAEVLPDRLGALGRPRGDGAALPRRARRRPAERMTAVGLRPRAAAAWTRAARRRRR